MFLWRDTHQLDPYKPLPGQPIEIQAVALDWKWLFIYPAQNVATVNRLVIPAGQPVHLSLTSATVMQSFLMPRLAGQIYAMAGMRTQLNFAARPAHSWRERAVQRHGLPEPEIRVAALDADLRALAGRNQGAAEPARRGGVSSLSRRSTLPHPLAFGAVDPGLFDRIVELAQPSGHTIALRNMPPRPLPMETSPHD